MKLTRLLNEFIASDKVGGLILIVATAFSLGVANSPYQISYLHFWHTNFYGGSLIHWINDGLMTLFFLVIGLELKREILVGELSNFKNALLPIYGAIGGMLVPVGLYLLLNQGTEFASGAGIPMATDIAFAIGILGLLGNRVPTSLKIFLTALAVIDDLGAILIIAIFYTEVIVFTNLFFALGIFGFLIMLNRLNVSSLIPYLIGGVAMWLFMLHSGVHATITGVLLAFTIPFKDGLKKSTSTYLQYFLKKPVAFVILPLFAAANTCISLEGEWGKGLAQSSSLGIILGLTVGKPLGIWLFARIGVILRHCALPSDLKWKNIFGAGILGGIGFTMSIFISLIAFENVDYVTSSKVAILLASVISGAIGFIYLRLTLVRQSGTTN